MRLGARFLDEHAERVVLHEHDAITEIGEPQHALAYIDTRYSLDHVLAEEPAPQPTPAKARLIAPERIALLVVRLLQVGILQRHAIGQIELAVRTTKDTPVVVLLLGQRAQRDFSGLPELDDLRGRAR